MLQLLMEQAAPIQMPPEVELIISAMEAGRHPAADRRGIRRNRYRVHGRLRLFSDPEQSLPWTLYSRDVHARGLGFVTAHRLPLSYGGMLELPHPEGGLLNIQCTIFRCRQTVMGWYEGAVGFNREQPEFT
jgi:hypothetical protein